MWRKDNMSTQYLRDRMAKMSTTYRDRWPRWSNGDYAAVSSLLDANPDDKMQSALQRIADAVDNPLPEWDAVGLARLVGGIARQALTREA